MEKTVGCAEHKAMAREVSEKAVTLVKSKEDVFPLTPEKYRRILIVPAKGAAGGGIFALMKGGKGPTTADKVKQLSLIHSSLSGLISLTLPKE